MMQRKPQTATPMRIAPMASLPLFHKLEGRKVVVAGHTEGAVWKVELLAAAGAKVIVFAGEDTAAFEEIEQSTFADRITLIARNWQADDLSGAALALADVKTDLEAACFVEAAHRAGAIVNIIDKPAFCDVQFGSIVNRSPLLVAISTDGAAPVFGQAIRLRIETLLAQGLHGWAQAAKSWRPLVQKQGLSFAARRRFWEVFTDRAFEAPNRKPTDQDREAMLSELEKLQAKPMQGRVTLVGAGPGDAELLTVKAIRALQSADIILFDDLVSAEVLELARREAKRMLVGKTGHGPSCKQSDINDLMVSLAKTGKHVVRLKSGDPLIFGRATEEIQACQTANIPVTIVPGISAAQAAGASLKVSLTERRVARRVQFLTGHADDGLLPSHIDWTSISDPNVTTILYMPKRTLAQFASQAIEHGLVDTTPAIALVNISRHDEARVASNIRDLHNHLGQLPEGPMLVMIGSALRNAYETLDTSDLNEIRELYSLYAK